MKSKNDGQDAVYPGRGRAWYSLTVLWLIFMFSNVDRYVISVLVQPIKAELALSDLQIGLLTGFAFSITYALFSVPVANLSDRGYRQRVLTICIILWSGATAACGLAQSFVQLALARFGVGASEGGVSPFLQSIVSALFPRKIGRASCRERVRSIVWYSVVA